MDIKEPNEKNVYYIAAAGIANLIFWLSSIFASNTRSVIEYLSDSKFLPYLPLIFFSVNLATIFSSVTMVKGK